jgi:hypothetical protein
VATSAATIAWVVEDFDEPLSRERGRFDLGQATMARMIAAADQGIGRGHAGVRDIRRRYETCSDCRSTAGPHTCSRSGIPPTDR